jgi:hypothetical protein
MVDVRVTWARKLTTGELSSMLDVTAHSSTSSADPDALALLAYSLGDLGHVTQRQTERLLTNRQTADHASALGLFASRLSKSSGVTEAVSRDFAHADGRPGSAFLGIAQTIRSRPIAKKGKNFASHSSGQVVSKRTARAAVVGRKKTLTLIRSGGPHLRFASHQGVLSQPASRIGNPSGESGAQTCGEDWAQDPGETSRCAESTDDRECTNNKCASGSSAVAGGGFADWREGATNQPNQIRTLVWHEWSGLVCHVRVVGWSARRSVAAPHQFLPRVFWSGKCT